jgi:hypothetical protein
MEIDMKKIRTQDETKESAAIDEANKRVDAKMKVIEKETKEQVAEALHDEASTEVNDASD